MYSSHGYPDDVHIRYSRKGETAGGPTETDFIPSEGRTGAYMQLLSVDVMNAALLWLCSPAADKVTAARFIGKHWDPEDPNAAREDTGAPPRTL